MGCALVLGACAGTSPDARPAPATASDSRPPADTTCTEAECLAEQGFAIWQGAGAEASVRFVEKQSTALASGSAICHDGLHRLGVLVAAHEESPQFGSDALVACSGGFFHGLFAGYGLRQDWVDLMVESCRTFTGVDALLCKHGYGHGAAVVDDIKTSLLRCENLARRDGAASVEGVSLLELCSDGLFMEVVHLHESGRWMVADPIGACSKIDSWAAWGCWRQLGRLVPIEQAENYSDSCNKLDEYLAEACAVGVAELLTGAGVRDSELCAKLRFGAGLCSDRIQGRRS